MNQKATYRNVFDQSMNQVVSGQSINYNGTKYFYNFMSTLNLGDFNKLYFSVKYQLKNISTLCFLLCSLQTSVLNFDKRR